MAKKEKKEIVTMKDFTKVYGDALVDTSKLVRDSSQLLRTGSIKLDLQLRGGLRAGTMSELYGAEGGGKSTIALMTCKQVLDAGGSVLYIDLEKGLDGGVDLKEGHIEGWMEKIGVSPRDPNLHVARPPTGEQVYELVEAAIKAGLFDLIVLDSMAALIPLADLTGDIGDSAFGRVAKLNAEAFKRILLAYDTQKVEKTHFMVINQARDNMGGHGLKSTGGRALRHFVSTKLKCTRVGKVAEYGINIIRVRTDKSRFSPPWEEVELYIHPECGIDLIFELLELGQVHGFVIKKGTWYTVLDPTTEEELFKVQGKEKAKAKLAALPEVCEIMKTLLYEEGMQGLVKK